MKHTDLANWFTHHPPTPEQINFYKEIRDKAFELAIMFNAAVPDCADKTAAMRDLRGTMTAMNLAIACYQEPTDGQ